MPAPYTIVASFTLPDRTVHVGETAGRIPWAAGQALSVSGGLVIRDEPRVTLDSRRTESMPLTVVGDPMGLREGASLGQMPSSMTVEVSMLRQGTDWDTRETLIKDARVSRLSQDLGTGGAMQMTVERNLVALSKQAGEDGTIHDSIVGKLTLIPSGSFYNTGEHDAMWPLALGRPYGVPLIRFRRDSTDDDAIVAGHALPAGDLTVYNNGSALLATSRYDPEPQTVSIRQDPGVDRAFSYVNGLAGTGSGAGPSWENEDGTATNYCESLTTDLIHGGAKNARGEVILGAGMVLEHCLRESGLPVDWPKMQRTIKRLQSWDVGLYIDGRDDWMSIVRDRMATVLPIREHQSDDGIWFSYHVPWEQQPRGTLTEGVDIHLTGAVEWDMQVINSVVIRYRYRYDQRDYTATKTVGPQQSALCAASASPAAFGDRPAPPLNTTLLHTDSAVIRAGLVIAQANALPRRTVQGFMTEAWSGVEVGDTFLMDSTTLGGTGILVQVLEVPRRPGSGPVVLQTVPRTAQATPGS